MKENQKVHEGGGFNVKKTTFLIFVLLKILQLRLRLWAKAKLTSGCIKWVTNKS